MHELKIASDLSEIVLETAKGAGLSKVTRVKIRFGQMIQIVPETFEFAFRETVRGTVAEGAGMEVEIINLKIRCRECGHVVIITDNSFTCRACNSSDLDIIEGKELYIESIEGE